MEAAYGGTWRQWRGSGVQAVCPEGPRLTGDSHLWIHPQVKGGGAQPGHTQTPVFHYRVPEDPGRCEALTQPISVSLGEGVTPQPTSVSLAPWRCPPQGPVSPPVPAPAHAWCAPQAV